LCGTTSETDDGRVISMKSAFEIDPTLRGIADLPAGWTARRERVGGEWSREADTEM